MSINRRELVERRQACRNALAIPDLPQEIADGFRWFLRHAGERLASAYDPVRFQFSREWAAKWQMLAGSARHAEARDACLQIAAAWDQMAMDTRNDDTTA